jgi:hypothetical protein
VTDPTDVPTTPDAAPGEAASLERAAAALGRWLSPIRRIPAALLTVVWISAAAGLLLAWTWFLGRDLVVIRWLAVPWLLVVGGAQLVLWLVAKSLRDVIELPGRIRALASDLMPHAEYVVRRLRRAEDAVPPGGGLVRKIREANRLRTDLAELLSTRAVMGRVAGIWLALLGLGALAVDGAIVIAALLQVALSS